ncbi:RNA methyltransferase [Acidiphilium acidophilum]|uniref:TrmH family RNA methyltransferase n=1 Tax=Acidiphilium acidophilum TaxID=76588 RepID=UPI002E8E7386|nr:RNA methyltransferase [Acidiphilium acidophilum]
MEQRDQLRKSGKPRPQGQNQGGRPEHRGRQDAQRDRRPSAGTASGLWLYGVHPVEAALANPARRLRRLVLTEEGEAALAARLPKPWAIPGERIERDKLDAMLGRGVVHQGIGLQADPLANPSLADALKRRGPVVVLDQITDPRNVGAIMRSAQAFGAALVIAQERNAPEEGGALAKAASGALERIPLLRTVNIARALIALKAADIWVMGLDAAGTTRLSGAALGGRRAALVLGAEGEGLRRLTRETCDELVSLAMPGGMESLNVSAAAAVALYEIIR